MLKINKKQQNILNFLLKKRKLSSFDIYNELKFIGEEQALVTVKRRLSEMVKMGIIITSGYGPATIYEIGSLGRIFSEVDIKSYCSLEPDKRYGLNSFNFDLFSSILNIQNKNKISNNIFSNIFTDIEIKKLEEVTQEYQKRIQNISPTIQKKELERLTIELSWKSSKIEGNTYNLLDTEKLVLENEEAQGHSKTEAIMILNHKIAFNFIHENKIFFKKFSLLSLEKLHSLLVKDLSINFGLRKKPVGVIGSKYRPLDNIYQINEAIENLANIVNNTKNPYEKALIALVGISYIQPFEDGNKRTSRLMANAFLMACGCAPLSYRSLDEKEYRDAVIIFYELNSINLLKKLFIEQYIFAAHNYTVK